jgi:aminoglycoside/choline kinase family phosphotransferase
VQDHTEKLYLLFSQWSGNKPDTIVPLPPSGSERKYCRLVAGEKSAIAAWNPVVEENEAFLYFSRHFRNHGLHVPEVYGADAGKEIYLIEDLGDTSLFTLVEQRDNESSFPSELVVFYKNSLKELIQFQVVAGKDLDYNYCYPYSAFDTRSMRWDLNYFKYYFLKLHVNFHEGKLEDDFDTLLDYLGKVPSDFFMYRDFQSRNISIKNNQPYFIDYQGGRKGPLQYDVASLLFQVKADLPNELREELLEYYIDELSSIIKINKAEFREQYYVFVLIRLLQVLGAYGFRGLYEKKRHFLVSIPYALKNLAWWIENVNLPVELSELHRCLLDLSKVDKYQQLMQPRSGTPLVVTVQSFSYRNGIPDDLSGNGGGFVFDCRALPNPGREERYWAFNGRDQIIIDYLKDLPEVIRFLDEAEKLVSQSIENYLERSFNSLIVNFGCTGGQHRSVYCAETLTEKLREKYKNVIFKGNEQETLQRRR